MSRRWVVLGAAVALAAAGWWALSRRGQHTGGSAMSDTPRRAYATYRGSHDARLAVGFEYPADWRLREEQGTVQVYSLVRLLGPRNAEDTFSSLISVRVAPTRSHGGRFDNLAALVENRKAHALPGARIEQEGERVIAGSPAKDLTVSYTMSSLQHKNLKLPPIPVMTRTVLLERGLYLYELVYSADTREYARHAGAFDHLLDTLRFQ